MTSSRVSISTCAVGLPRVRRATMRRSRGVVALAVALAGATFAQAREFSGVTLPDTLSAGGKTLKLNGGALRKKAIFKVYVGGLYLEAPSKDAGAIFAADTAKAVCMHFIRSVSKDQLVEALGRAGQRHDHLEGRQGDRS